MGGLKILVVIHTVFLQSLFAASPSIDEFKLVKKDATLSLYERWIAAEGGDKVREIKAVFSVKTGMPAIVRLLKDQSKGKEWNMDAKAYRILRFPEEHRWITYIEYGFPWPMDNQDCCLLYHYRESPASSKAEISFESTLHNQFPVSKNIMRITGTKGKWIMEQQRSGEMKITYLITTDRSKKVPRWVSDPIIHSHLFKTMTKFKNILETTAHE